MTTKILSVVVVVLLLVTTARSCHKKHGKDYLKKHLIGHWKMDDAVAGYAVDDSGSELHGTVTSGTTDLGKFSRSFRFDGSSFEPIRIQNNPIISFGTKSFSFTAWIKINDYTYPKTTLAVRQGNLCYSTHKDAAFTPGWDIGHVHSTDHTEICIRDEMSNFAFIHIKHDPDFPHSKLRGKWTHYSVVFNRIIGKTYLYLNGKRQGDFADISKVTGSINNDLPLEFGTIYGWTTDGNVDEYRLYNIALDDEEVLKIYNDHRV